MQGEENFYCEKIHKTVRIMFDYNNMENGGIYRTERVLSNQEFNCEKLIDPEHCMFCSPMTKYDIWEKLIKGFIGKN
jgi:hypothetical protein